MKVLRLQPAAAAAPIDNLWQCIYGKLQFVWRV